MRSFGTAPERVKTRKQLEELLGPLKTGMSIIVEQTPPDWKCVVYRGECSCCQQWSTRPWLARLVITGGGVIEQGKALPCCSEECAQALAVTAAVEAGA